MDQSLVHLVFVTHFYSLNQCVPFQAFIICSREVAVGKERSVGLILGSTDFNS